MTPSSPRPDHPHQAPCAAGPELPPVTPRPTTAETPLAGLRVVDFTHFIAGPYCTMILADMGAEVIKIEGLDGDGFRHYPPKLAEESVPYLWTNRNKASVALDLKSAAGRRVALDLIATADVVAENFSTGVMQRLGLDYANVAQRKPDIIYCSISAYGRSGPYADRIGFDPILQAESGFISMNGRPDQEGMRAGPSVMDISTAMISATAILGAVVARQRTGQGQYIETTLIETAINMLGNFSLAHLATGAQPTRFGNTQPTACPVGAFETEDAPIYLACANDRTFQRLARDVLKRPDLADHPDYANSALRRDHASSLLAEVAAELRRDTRANWLSRMHAVGVPAGAIRSVAEAMAAPEIRERGLLSSIPHPTLGSIPNVGLPMKLFGTPLADPVAAPLLGAQTGAVLRRLLGLDDAGLAELAASGALGPDWQEQAR